MTGDLYHRAAVEHNEDLRRAAESGRLARSADRQRLLGRVIAHMRRRDRTTAIIDRVPTASRDHRATREADDVVAAEA